MPRQLALLICIFFVLWLFARDRKWRPMTSWALWIPLLWIAIVGSRPASLWFGGGIETENPAAYLEGSPLDRYVFLVLFVIGLVVLCRRGVNWGRILASNGWLFAFILYCGISVIWSDYPFVSFKRWVKELGNVVMIVIILTDKDPVQAIKAVFARFTYLVIPLSVVLIKYFREVGTYYNRWTWETVYAGVTTNKNTLGCLLFVCGLFLVWDLIEMRTAGGRKTGKADVLDRVVLLSMIFWLIHKADSSTALVCLIVGAGIVLFMRRPFARRQVRYLGTYSLVLGLLILFLYSFPGLLEAFTEMVGRNTTFTGRTDIWAALLKEPINPLLGTGYQSFWIPATRERYHLNQAHNGYLETYLNSGLIGLCLLMALIVSTGSKLKKELLLGSSYGTLCFSFLVAAVFYNWTEAVFSGLSLVWITLLIAVLNYPRWPRSIPENVAESANEDPFRMLSKRRSNASAPYDAAS